MPEPTPQHREIAREMWNVAVQRCNEEHGTGGMDDYQICGACGENAIAAALARTVAEEREEALALLRRYRAQHRELAREITR